MDDNRQLLLKEYELGVQYLTNQFSRMWTRFNFFMTFESALALALIGFFKDKGLTLASLPIGVVGLLTSVCWYAFGAQDRYLVEVYRLQIEHSAEQLRSGAGVKTAHVGLGPIEIEKRLDKRVGRSVLQWGSKALSVTKLAAAFPLLVALAWLVLTMVILGLA